MAASRASPASLSIWKNLYVPNWPPNEFPIFWCFRLFFFYFEASDARISSIPGILFNPKNLYVPNWPPNEFPIFWCFRLFFFYFEASDARISSIPGILFNPKNLYVPPWPQRIPRFSFFYRFYTLFLFTLKHPMAASRASPASLSIWKNLNVGNEDDDVSNSIVYCCRKSLWTGGGGEMTEES